MLWTCCGRRFNFIKLNAHWIPLLRRDVCDLNRWYFFDASNVQLTNAPIVVSVRRCLCSSCVSVKFRTKYPSEIALMEPSVLLGCASKSLHLMYAVVVCYSLTNYICFYHYDTLIAIYRLLLVLGAMSNVHWIAAHSHIPLTVVLDTLVSWFDSSHSVMSGFIFGLSSLNRFGCGFNTCM